MIQPYRIDVPQADLDDLKARLTNVRWPSEIPDVGWSRGVPLGYLKGLVEYWRDGYDWRKHEAELNELPQFTTEIDGQAIHFFHIRSPHDNATPLLLAHGWPSSIVDFLQVIKPLTEPADPADAFHLVIPSLPNFPLTGPMREAGWDSTRMARAFAELMRRLGYERYGAQGGDFGAFIAPAMAQVDTEHVIGVHVNAATFGFIPWGEVDEETMAQLTDVEKERLARLANWSAELNGYFQLQSTRPQTVAYGLNDSPVFQLSWIVEKFHDWTHGGDVPEDVVDRDHLLTNVMLYWISGAGASSAHIYYDSMHGSGEWLPPSGTPTGVAVFAEDIAIRRFGEQMHNITHWSDFETGGQPATGLAPPTDGAAVGAKLWFTSRPWRSPSCSSRTCARFSPPSDNADRGGSTIRGPMSDKPLSACPG